jgi:aminopeptidase N
MTSYQTTYLKDYQPANFLVETVNLTFDLAEDKTIVTAVIDFHKNAQNQSTERQLRLNGEKLILRTIKLNNKELPASEYSVTDKELTLLQPPENFTLTLVTEIEPQNNTELTGLYKSNAMFCTQCEAQGFRRITYFLDRPDVMARYTTKIIADKTHYPILLSNGNLVDAGDLADNKHFVVWEDPFRKPSYLFALVAGDLECLTDQFITQSGRDVALKIYVETGNRDKAYHALYALKQAMRWDEINFGREYDLDIYMIVAASDFNMGAMENKGLNIFNTKYILADPNMATDDDYQAIIGVIGHEYFHNWTGNRVTCRDWFQLSLKEGLTIFRDHEFTGDMTSLVANRIKNVRQLRAYQFAEDAGPMAHPVQPDSYIEINNFYTTTIYEKGSEVIQMMKTLLGKEGFRLGMDLYFERHDGQAATIEDFVKAMEDANHFDLTQFRLWYKQAGTPRLHITRHYSPANKEYTLTIKQICPQTPGQKDKKPFHIPIAMSLVDRTTGQELTLKVKNTDTKKTTKQILELKETTQTFIFSDIPQEPVPILLENFSAPVHLDIKLSEEELSILMMHANDLFSRWEAAQTFFLQIINQMIENYQHNQNFSLTPKFIAALKANLTNTDLDPAFITEMITLPSERYICGMQTKIDIDAIHHSRRFILKTIAQALSGEFLQIYQNNSDHTAYKIDQTSIKKRQLKNLCLQYLMLVEQPGYTELCLNQYQQSNNMSDRISALHGIINSPYPQKKDCLADFYLNWKHEPLVVDKWFSLQAMSNRPDAFDEVLKLTKHEAFTIKNPNRVRSLIGAFSSNNLFHFHRADGAGYEFLANYIIQLNSLNPQIASRLLEPLTNWRQFDAARQDLMKQQLKRIGAVSGISDNVYEVITKCLQ